MGERLIVIARQPNLTAAHNKDSWAKIINVFDSAQYATRGELVAACKGHNFPGGAETFVGYCLINGWLREVTVETKPGARARSQVFSR